LEAETVRFAMILAIIALVLEIREGNE